MENSTFQEGIMSETFQRLGKSFFQNPKELGDLVDKENFIHKYLPKQTDRQNTRNDTKKAIKGHIPVHGD